MDLEGFRAMMREVGIEEVVDSTLAVYLSEAPEIIERIEGAVEAGDADEIRAAAHSLKSSSGNIRANRLSELMAELEHLGRDGKTVEAAQMIESAKAEHERVMAYLRSEAG